MNLHDLIFKCVAASVTVILKDIHTLDCEILADTQQRIEETLTPKKAKRLYSPKEASEILDVNLSTLWRWKKRGYLVPIEVGGKRKYKDEDINAILEGREQP